MVELNVLESIREFARWQVGSLTLEEDGMILASGTSDSPLGYSNCVARADRSTAPELVLERADEFFGGQGRGYTLWVCSAGDEALERAALDRGLRAVSESPWMNLAEPIAEVPAPAGVDLVLVKDEAGVRDAAAVNREAYQSLAFSAEDVDAIYGNPARALEPHVQIWVAYERGEPVSTAMALHTAGVAGVYWVGTRDAGRRKGYAGLCTRAAANGAFRSGARLVTLQATRMGESLYRQLGFRVVAAHRWLLQAVARTGSGLWMFLSCAAEV